MSKSPYRSLAEWFDRQKRVLPWRDQPTLYRVWISEIMLQQTQVVTVIPYFEKFIARFPTVEALAAAAESEILLHWAGLGYYSRARNIHKTAKQIVQTGFPRDREGWLAMSGVGAYTAGAILSIALDEPEAILDGNVERVLSRYRRVSRQKGDVAYKSRLWRLSRIFVERAHAEAIRPSTLNQALMELGATVCTYRKPTCLACPLREGCRALQAGQIEAYPPKKKPKTWIDVREELHCLVDSDGRVLLRLRERGEWRAGLWDFLDAEPTSAGVTAAERVGTIESKHVVTRHKITRLTHVWRAPPRPQLAVAESDAREYRWLAPGAPDVAVGSALKRSLMMIRERFGSQL